MPDRESRVLPTIDRGEMDASAREVERLFVCYIPGFDLRRIDPETTPFVADRIARGPMVRIRTLPNTELLPTMATGVYPHEHGVWQVRLREDEQGVFVPRAGDRLPDLLSTTWQCFRQYLDPDFDLATIPARRRRRFELHRFKYTRRQKDDSPLRAFGEIPSIFGLLGPEARYLFTKRFDQLPSLAGTLPTATRRLEFLEMYALDLFQHWNLDRPEAMRAAYAETDRFVRKLHERCRARGVALLLLVDHGQERVVGTIPLRQAVASTGLSDREYSYFVELALARFWFHTDRARRRLLERLAQIEGARLLTWKEMHQFDVRFPDATHGEIYLAADAGRIFFPHDFHHPLANLFLGLTDRNQRRRVGMPIHRGNHGYLPHFPSERGWAVLAEPDRFRAARPEIELIDLAPTVLSLLGRKPTERMRGSTAFVS